MTRQEVSFLNSYFSSAQAVYDLYKQRYVTERDSNYYLDYHCALTVLNSLRDLFDGLGLSYPNS